MTNYPVPRSVGKNHTVNLRPVVGQQPTDHPEQPGFKRIWIFLNIGKILYDVASHNKIPGSGRIPRVICPGLITNRFFNRSLHNHIIVAMPVEQLQPRIKAGFAAPSGVRFAKGKANVSGTVQVLYFDEHGVTSRQTISQVHQQRCSQPGHFISDKWDVIDNDHNGKFTSSKNLHNDVDERIC